MNKNDFSTKTAHGAVFVGMEDIGELIIERISAGQSVELSPRGRSMLPMLREGVDSVTLSPAPNRLSKYDIPLYRRSDGSYILHRVVDVSDGKYTMCGDNQFRLERGIDHDRVIAVVSGFSRGKKRYSTKSAAYRIYVALWCGSRPLRYFAHRVVRKLKRIIGK
jgi:hypothetical protein